MTTEVAERIAGLIASGHAFDKHVLREKEFPSISDRAGFQNLILEVLIHPDEQRPLGRGRHAYWSDKRTTLVIVDP